MSLLQKISAVTFAAGFALMAVQASAEPFQPPTGEVILTIDGALAGDAPAGGYVLDMAALKALPAIEYQTTTIWTEGMQVFTGVSLKKLLEAAGASGTMLEAEALNGYIVEIDLSTLEDDAPILAYQIGGKEFSRRDKGPLWIVYPYDREERFKSELTYANSVWQLQKLNVK